jgi:acyl-CoA synthetase (AMP-forming)/AMP-acid ligase II
VSFTSGTTGDPKGIMHTTGTLGSINASMTASYGLGEDDVIFMGAPIGHSIGFYHGIRMSIFLGAKLVFLDEWDARRARQLIEQEDATYTTMAVPHLYDLLQEMDGFSGRLRYILCGGSPVSEKLMREARARLPHTLTTRLWGMTEGIGTACRPGTSEDKLFSTDGQPFPGTELRFLSPDLKDVAVGETGHLAMRGPHLFSGYFERPDLNDDLFLPDGFFLTGDLATQDGDGYVTIVGREKDIIIRGGVNIAPAALERVLAEEPSIAQVAVIGSPDPRLGERICAVVVPREGETVELADLVARASAAGLAKQGWPERLVILGELPTTPSGKIQKVRLRKLITDRSVDVNVAEAPGR